MEEEAWAITSSSDDEHEGKFTSAIERFVWKERHFDLTTVGNMSKGKASTSTNDDDYFKIEEKWLIDPGNIKLGVQIGSGASSTVLEGSYNSIPVAVKIVDLKIRSAATQDLIKNCRREYLALSRIEHDNVVKFIGASSVDSKVKIVTELMKGETLETYLRRMRPRCPHLNLTISFALEISTAMEYLHDKGIIHRDLKPDNLLLTEDRMHIKLADFGLAIDRQDEEAKNGMFCMTSEPGTCRWMAPEMFPMQGKKCYYDHKVDVYSFSIVLWQLLTNKIPFEGMTWKAVVNAVTNNGRPSVENLPSGFVRLLQSCWEAEPTRRLEFKEIIGHLRKLSSTQTESRPPEIVEMTDDSTLQASTSITTPPPTLDTVGITDHVQHSEMNIVVKGKEDSMDANKSDHDHVHIHTDHDKGKKHKTSPTSSTCKPGCFSCFRSSKDSA